MLITLKKGSVTRKVADTDTYRREQYKALGYTEVATEEVVQAIGSTLTAGKIAAGEVTANTVTATEPASNHLEADAEAPEEVPLDALSYADLKAKATELGLKFAGNISREALLDLIKGKEA